MSNERINDMRESMQVAWLKFKRVFGRISDERLVRLAFFEGFICGAEKQQAVWGEIIDRVVCDPHTSPECSELIWPSIDIGGEG